MSTLLKNSLLEALLPLICLILFLIWIFDWTPMKEALVVGTPLVVSVGVVVNVIPKTPLPRPPR